MHKRSFFALALLLPLTVPGTGVGEARYDSPGGADSIAKTIPPHAAASDRVSVRPELLITTLGFGSCARQNRPQPIWDTINAVQCDAFVLCGDNIYGDSADPAVLREKYALFAAMPGFAKLRQSTPLFATGCGGRFPRRGRVSKGILRLLPGPC
jgi:hypothetical protein